MRTQHLATLVALLASSTVGSFAACTSSSPGNAASSGDAGADAVACPNPNALDASPTQLELPRPTGPYAIGTQRRKVVDMSRTDPQAPDPTAKRTLMVQVYYPTDPCTPGPRAPYVMPAEAVLLTTEADAGSNLPVGWQSQVLPHGRAAVPVSSDRTPFPVVLFSPGVSSVAGYSASLVEELVSHGFVVAVISHTYDMFALVFPDGTESDLNEPWQDAGVPCCGNGYLAAVYANGDAHIGVWVADARFVLDQLSAWNVNDPQGLLSGRLNLDRIGYYGASFGGAAVAEACALDPRVKAGISLDSQFASPTRMDGGRSLPTPFMIQLSELHATVACAQNGWGGDEAQCDPTVQNTYDQLQDAGYQLRIAGTRHMTFGDVPILIDKWDGPDAAPDLLGPIDHRRAIRIINAYDVAFFEKHLKGMAEPLLDGPPPYPEVTFNKR